MRILLAEKDEFYRDLIRARLSARGYETVEVEDSADVLQILNQEKIDLVLLSDELGIFDGSLLIEKIRAKPNLISVPVILMTDENKIAELVMSQARGYDDFLIKPFNALVLQLRIAINISKTHQRMEVNPLTHLPGNISIERVILKKIEQGEKFSVLYLDINHFKSFNDRYGFEKGDEILKHVASLLVETSEEVIKDGRCFVGHIGGDDFVVITHPDYEESFARTFIVRFDRAMPLYYSKEDQKRGKIRVTNRRGKREDFPLMSCSIAACNNLHHAYSSLGEIARDAAEVKNFLKMQEGSHYLRDRRSSPIRNLKEAAEVLEPDLRVNLTQEAKNSTQPLGQILLRLGIISRDQLSVALRRHKRTGKKIGQVLLAMATINEKDLGTVLSKQLDVPFYSLDGWQPEAGLLERLNKEFIKTHRVLPLETGEGELKLGMCDPLDIRTMDAVRILTGLSPKPQLILDDAFQSVIDRMFHQTAEQEKAG